MDERMKTVLQVLARLRDAVDGAILDDCTPGLDRLDGALRDADALLEGDDVQEWLP